MRPPSNEVETDPSIQHPEHHHFAAKIYLRYVQADCIDLAHHLMAGNPRDARPASFILAKQALCLHASITRTLRKQAVQA